MNPTILPINIVTKSRDIRQLQLSKILVYGSDMLLWFIMDKQYKKKTFWIVYFENLKLELLFF